MVTKTMTKTPARLHTFSPFNFATGVAALALLITAFNAIDFDLGEIIEGRPPVDPIDGGDVAAKPGSLAAIARLALDNLFDGDLRHVARNRHQSSLGPVRGSQPHASSHGQVRGSQLHLVLPYGARSDLGVDFRDCGRASVRWRGRWRS